MEKEEIRLRCLELAIEIEKENDTYINEYRAINIARTLEDFILESKNKD